MKPFLQNVTLYTRAHSMGEEGVLTHNGLSCTIETVQRSALNFQVASLKLAAEGGPPGVGTAVVFSSDSL